MKSLTAKNEKTLPAVCVAPLKLVDACAHLIAQFWGIIVHIKFLRKIVEERFRIITEPPEAGRTTRQIFTGSAQP